MDECSQIIRILRLYMILKYPYPYQGWFTIANDPDNTLIKDWRELNDFIWKELGLPLSNSLFVESFNKNLPDQVSLRGYPEIVDQPHDIIHTWGDYMHGREKSFDREDAIRAAEILRKYMLTPKVWIDHSRFVGNLIHNSTLGSIPSTKDASGITYKNYNYTLDLIQRIGIRYVWNGKVTSLIGQDKHYNRYHYRRVCGDNILSAAMKSLLSLLIHSKMILNYFSAEYDYNNQYKPVSFPDGRNFYSFTRYGTWKDADIYGLGRLLQKKNIDLLLRRKGTMAVYTHLGKRPHDKMHLEYHIPNKTKEALRYISQLYDEKRLMVSSLSNMLDYLVIRDNIVLSPMENKIEFRSDGIRFESLSLSILKKHKFSFSFARKFDISKLRVFLNQEDLKFNIEVEDDIATISFT